MANQNFDLMATLDKIGVRLDETNATLKENGAQLKETGAKMAASNANFDRKLAESSANFNREMAESRDRFDREMAASRAEFNQRMKKLDELIGCMANNNGLIAEEYFFNSFEKGQTNFFGEKFDSIRKNIKGLETNDEYDILLINGQTLCIVEIKYKAHKNDVPKVLKKAETFRINFPKYQNHRVYLGLATPAFYHELEQECTNLGIAVIKQVGETIVINDQNMKAF